MALAILAASALAPAMPFSGAVYADSQAAGVNRVTATLLAGPTALQVTSGSGQVSLAWSPASTSCNAGQAHQAVLRDGATIATLGSGAASYDDSAATTGTHTYKVQTTCAGWVSSDQPSGTGTVGLSMPAVKPGKVLLAPTYGGSGTVPPALGSGVVAVAGSSSDLALLSTGAVYAWGQYSTSGYTVYSVPAAVQSGVVAIAAGGQYDMALKEDGSVVVWYGASPGNVYTVPPAATSGVVKIAAVVGSSASEAMFAALKSDGSAVFWGIPDGSNWIYPATPAPLTHDVTDFYGQDYSGYPGFYAVTASGDLYDVDGSNATAVSIPPVASLSAGGAYGYGGTSSTVALLKDGTVDTVISDVGSAGTLPTCSSKAVAAVEDGNWSADYLWRLCADGTLLGHESTYDSVNRVSRSYDYSYLIDMPGSLTKMLADNSYVMSLFDDGSLDLLSNGTVSQTWTSVADVTRGDQGWLILQSS